MAATTDSELDTTGWTPIATGAAETLLTSNGDGFFYVLRTTPPPVDLVFGHFVEGLVNEAVVTKAGETLYVRARSGRVTLVATVDAS